VRVGKTARLALLIWSAATALLAPTLQLGAAERVSVPVLPEARSRVSDTQGCVEPTAVMRRDHMTFLMHQRDRTVHEGIRTKRHSLVECIACHVSTDASGKPVPIDAAGQFCQSCHAFAGVEMDCFECHAATPADSASMRVGRPVVSTLPLSGGR
jgi:hypothetical protein